MKNEGNGDASDNPEKAKEPSLAEVMDDDDFIPELRQSNELLLK